MHKNKDGNKGGETSNGNGPIPYTHFYRRNLDPVTLAANLMTEHKLLVPRSALFLHKKSSMEDGQIVEQFDEPILTLRAAIQKMCFPAYRTMENMLEETTGENVLSVLINGVQFLTHRAYAFDFARKILETPEYSEKLSAEDRKEALYCLCYFIIPTDADGRVCEKEEALIFAEAAQELAGIIYSERRQARDCGMEIYDAACLLLAAARNCVLTENYGAALQAVNDAIACMQLFFEKKEETRGALMLPPSQKNMLEFFDILMKVEGSLEEKVAGVKASIKNAHEEETSKVDKLNCALLAEREWILVKQAEV
ncbi:MAG: hypothetical protein Q7T16_05910 [Candidatus Burarchaeum sp.]|nr:hypothetical protein [Candidatus Burarchaeum sp.]MDO8340162.1 hypothetical protein [Candidatus Burarchaeum sp.]